MALTEVPELSLVVAGERLRQPTWRSGLLIASLGVADVVAGGLLMARSDPGDWNSSTGVVEGSSVAEARRWGAAMGMLALGAGQVAGALVTWATLARYRHPVHIRARLGSLRFWDRPWLNALMTGLAFGLCAGVGTATYALADDPTIEGLGLAILVQTVGLAITVPIGQWLNRRLRPYHPLAGP